MVLSQEALQPLFESIGQMFQAALKTVDLNRLNEIHAQYLKESADLFAAAMQELSPNAAEGKGDAPYAKLLDKLIDGDRRFSASEWRDRGFFELNAAIYALNARYTQMVVDSVKTDEKTKAKLKYAVQQVVDAMAPSNFFVTNPEAQKKVLQTSGESLTLSLENILADIQKGRITQTDESAFEVGHNVATTPGAVVFENDVFQLIQYTPKTEKVGSTPILFVPPCINKFYILDLQPQNSYVAYTVEQGHTLFLVSWKNPTEPNTHHTWSTYVEDGIIKAIDVARSITKQKTVNAMGFCVGGTLLCTALSVLAARGEKWVESLTLLTTLLDFTDAGMLGVFVDETQVAIREQTIGEAGIMPGKELSGAFSSLRPNDLVWNYVVSNYLKGEKPPAFDLLYWNSDSTNLPGPLFCWYLRKTYLENRLCQPNAEEVCGEKVDFSLIDIPCYLMAAREDHIVPWAGAYRSVHLLDGPIRFVLGASGHIAGVVNPASKNKRSYWVNDDLPETADQWMVGAKEIQGSWWNDWSQWLEPHKGKLVKAPAKLGSAKYPPIEAAPGRYVKVRVA
jgi:polyhydroxyalkanoate synthase